MSEATAKLTYWFGSPGLLPACAVCGAETGEQCKRPNATYYNNEIHDERLEPFDDR